MSQRFLCDSFQLLHTLAELSCIAVHLTVSLLMII